MSKCQNLYLGWRIELDDKPITRPKEEWIAAILQNSRYAFLSIHNGQDKLEMFQKSFKIVFAHQRGLGFSKMRLSRLRKGRPSTKAKAGLSMLPEKRSMFS